MIDSGGLWLFFAAALLPSIMGAISGIGGGIIIKPALDAFSPFSPQEINFLSGTTVLAMSAVSLVRHRKDNAGMKDRRGAALALGAILGGAAGKLIFTAALSLAGGELVGITESGLLITLCGIVQIYMLRKNNIKPLAMQNPALCFLPGLGMGMVSAFMGIGGGPINIMIISYFLGLDSKTTGLYSLFVIFLSQLASLTSVLAAGKLPALDPSVLIVMIAGGVSGGYLGSLLIRKMSNRQVDTLFKIILIGVMLLSFYRLAKIMGRGDF